MERASSHDLFRRNFGLSMRTRFTARQLPQGTPALDAAPNTTNDLVVAGAKNGSEFLSSYPALVKQEFLEGRAVLQDQVHIRALAVDFFVSLLRTVEGWAERTLAEIEGWEDLSPDGKNERGLENFASLPVPSPHEPIDQTPVPPASQRRRRSSRSGTTP